MQDFIVTHVTLDPRVVQAVDADEACRATIRDLGWNRRTIVRFREPEDPKDTRTFGRWLAGMAQDELIVRPFVPSEWTDTEVVRLTRKGTFIERFRVAIPA